MSRVLLQLSGLKEEQQEPRHESQNQDCAAIMLSKFLSHLLPCLAPTFSGKDALWEASMPGSHSIQLFAQQEGGVLPSFTYQSQGKPPNGPAWVMCTPLEPIPGAREWASMISTV